MGTKVTELPQEILWRLDRADGFLDLNMTDHARQELFSIPPEYTETKPFLEVQLRLSMLKTDWNAALQTIVKLKQLMPDDPSYWVQWAYITRRSKTIEEARVILLDAQARFKKIAVIPYNLACYECQMGHPEEALNYLKRAIRMDHSFSEIALEDEDLKPVWAKLENSQ